MQDFQFVMGFNRASIGLTKACATGQHIKTATLSSRKIGKGQQDYLTFKSPRRTHQLVPDERFEGAPPPRPVSFNFAKLEVGYKPQKADGSLGTGSSSGTT